jgi:hypothetical protein
MTPESEALDAWAISRLQSRYGDVVTRRAWAELEPLFLPGCPVRLDLRDGHVVELAGAQALGEFIAGAIERFDFFEFAVLNAVVDPSADPPADRARASGRVYIWELRQAGGGGPWTNAFGLYEDTYARHEGRWVFARRQYASLARTGDGPAVVFPVPPAQRDS